MTSTPQSSPGALHEDAAPSALSRLAELAAEFGAEGIAETARSIDERVSEGRFFVACVGQFKRGKSTLLNALIGENVLPTGIVPVTTVPTVIRYARERAARIRFRKGAWTDVSGADLPQYVSEEQNPENTKGVAGVEVFTPSVLLATGMCFVDTPGLGSVFAANTAATQAFIPHIDAALIVLGADPPIAGEELALAEAVGRQVKDLLVVLNKADRTTAQERDVARAFTGRVLEKRLGRPVGPILEVSAVERAEGRGPERDWPRLVAALQALVARSGRDLIRSAAERGMRRLGEQMLAVLAEEREALLRPLEESERRIAAMRHTLTDADRSLRELGYLFTAEQHRLSDLFLSQRKAFLAQTLPTAQREFSAALEQLPRGFGPQYRRAAMRGARSAAESHVLPWLEAEQARAEQEYRQVAGRFVDFGNEFLKRLAESGVPALARMPNALDPEAGFRVRSRFTFEDLIHVAQPASPLRYLADAALGLAGAHAAIAREAREFLLQLLEMNSTRVQSDVVDRVQESRGRLEAEIRKLLLEVSRTAQHALEHARAARAAGAPAVDAALARLDAAVREVRALLQQA
jgi:GTP-binding protein EngB required for normal cell division